jgi:hypothetical protein
MLFGSSYYTFPVAGGVAFIVWHLPINIGAGPELEFNWIKIANQHQHPADRYQIFVLHFTYCKVFILHLNKTLTKKR